MDKLLITGATVIDPSQGMESTADLLICGGKIADIAPVIRAEDAETIDASGLVCAPGLVDMHVHLRDPGQTHKEDIVSGCRAAAAGGVTSLVCMPNTIPPADTPDIVRGIISRAIGASARVYPAAAISKGLDGGELTAIDALAQAGAIAFTDDGKPVRDTSIMLSAMEQCAALGLRVLSHSEDEYLAAGGKIHLGEVSREKGIPGIHRAAEDAAVARDIALAEATGFPVHICHISTRGSVALLRDARRRGVPVTGETAPHYFLLTDNALRAADADFRMNPPLRTQDDVDAIIDGLCDGTLSAIATDHAPHTPAEKSDFLNAPNGVIGMETSLAAGITALVQSGRMGLRALIYLMSTAPALLLGIQAGTLATGAPADAVLFDPEEKWTVDTSRLHGKSINTPFKGMTLTGKVKMTVLGGRVVYSEMKGG